MTITSIINHTNLTSLVLKEITENELINTTITTRLIRTSTSNVFFRLFNSTRTYPFLRLPLLSTAQTKYFIFQSTLNRNMRYTELAILSLTLPVYVIIFMLLIELTIVRISRNTNISGGGSRSRSQQRQEHMRSLIWISNYLIVDFINLLYELIYLTVHLSGLLSLKSFVGRFYCQLQVYLPLYLTVLMAYSLTSISIYRRRHFVNLHNRKIRSSIRSFIMISALWVMPIFTSIIPAYLLIHSNILKITQHETTNQCQISYTYESNIQAIYIFYRLGNIFLLPISISLACYVAIYVDLIRMQRRFTKAFKRHVHIRKNLISQILFLFLNFAVFWLPAEIIMLYTKNRRIKDAAQVTKSLNILLDPLIIARFDKRFPTAARQLLSRWPFDQFVRIYNMIRQQNSTITIPTTITTTTTFSKRSQKTLKPSTWNIGNNDDITVFESVSNHSLQGKQQQQQQQQLTSSLNKRRLANKRHKSMQRRKKITENHV